MNNTIKYNNKLNAIGETIKEYELAVFSIIFNVTTDELLKQCIESFKK